ncbi:MAG: DUF3499 domain-containing protein [Actinobacteria bacterium]|jgi:hypothetical protein|nr:DUF3499 domain-containing protein [Actinomycetota bacterium]
MSKASAGATRMGRFCSRAGCRQLATKTLTYIYSDSTAVLGPLATFAEPHAYDLCIQHSARMSAPVGWTVIKQEPTQENTGPSSDDLMAIADAVREVGTRNLEPEIKQNVLTNVVPQEIGRRGHLRAIPNT